MADRIGVVVSGAGGRMGSETVQAILRDPGMHLLGVLTRSGDSMLSAGSTSVPVAPDLTQLLERLASPPQCVVDFTVAEVGERVGTDTLSRGIALVTGTTGMPAEVLATFRSLSQAHAVGCVVAPNFAIGAVLAGHFATIAARHFNWAEVIELHHEGKADAPSGTALATARAMAAARGQPFNETTVTKQLIEGTRGGSVDGVHLHSIRLQGLVAHQEVLFGGPGEVLTIKHDSMNRVSFMPGVLLAVRHAVSTPGYVFGLGSLLGLG